MGGADAVGLIDAATHTVVLDPRVLRWSLQAQLCGRSDEWQRFDALFDAHFLPPNKSVFAASGMAGARRAHRPAGTPTPTTTHPPRQPAKTASPTATKTTPATARAVESRSLQPTLAT